MSRPLSMSWIGCWQASALRQPGTAFRQMVAWMGCWIIQRVGIEATDTYGAGLLRYMQEAGIETVRSRRRTSMIVANAGKTMILTHQNAAPCTAFCRQAHRHAQKPQRHDRISARAQSLPQDGRRRPEGSPCR